MNNIEFERVTNVYWPTKIQTQLVLFNLCLWDAGDTAGKKYGHILPVRFIAKNGTGTSSL